MSWYNTKYKNDNGEYELNTGTLDYEQAKAIEKVCRAVIDGKVKSPDDVVVVVRCKDCRHMEKSVYGRYCQIWGMYNGYGDDGFCCYGERKEGAE